MNKSDLVAKVAEKTDITRKEAEKVVGAVLDTIIETLAAEEKVQLVGFGTFEVRHRAARKVNNPLTKAEMQVPASIAPAFKPGKGFKEALVAKDGK